MRGCDPNNVKTTWPYRRIPGRHDSRECSISTVSASATAGTAIMLSFLCRAKGHSIWLTEGKAPIVLDYFLFCIFSLFVPLLPGRQPETAIMLPFHTWLLSSLPFVKQSFRAYIFVLKRGKNEKDRINQNSPISWLFDWLFFSLYRIVFQRGRKKQKT